MERITRLSSSPCPTLRFTNSRALVCYYKGLNPQQPVLPWDYQSKFKRTSVSFGCCRVNTSILNFFFCHTGRRAGWSEGGCGSSGRVCWQRDWCRPLRIQPNKQPQSLSARYWWFCQWQSKWYITMNMSLVLYSKKRISFSHAGLTSRTAL